MRYILALSLALLAFSCQNGTEKSKSSLIPEPQEISVQNEKIIFQDTLSLRFTSASSLEAVFECYLSRLSNLTIIPSDKIEEKVDVLLAIDESLDSLAYKLSVEEGVSISAGSYVSAAFAISTLIQLGEFGHNFVTFPNIDVYDFPGNEYQTLMIDIARKPHTFETLKQAVDICFFYKIRNLQIHLSDDQSFAFTSRLYPELATPGFALSWDEQKALVDYAASRGVIITPEFDLPGHSASMRSVMPELFGAKDLHVVNLASPETWKAICEIAAEMMDVFYTSPYFHIGADEAYLEPLSRNQQVRDYLQEKGYHDVHDLFLEYIVRMNDFVKSKGRKTLVWESFDGKGSALLEIPNDIIVLAWETLYQHPQSLLNNGYTIVNASWKPLYVTPWMRWGQKEILDWNPAQWQNHWRITPSYHGIQLDTCDQIIGSQFCSWELPDIMQIPELSYRVPAFAAKTWSLWRNAPENFSERYQLQNKKLKKILWPLEPVVDGLSYADYEGVLWNRENYFSNELQVDFTVPEGCSLCYTLDGEMPSLDSKRWDRPQKFDEDVHFQAKLFSNDNKEMGYINRLWELVPIELEVQGNYTTPKDVNINNMTYVIEAEVTLHLKNLKGSGTLKYKADEDEWMDFVEDLKVNESKTYVFALFDDENKIVGKQLTYHFEKIDREYTLSTNKHVVASEEDPAMKGFYAVDGIVSREFFWGANSGAPQWLMVDLERLQYINRIKLYTYWDGSRFYQYRIFASVDGKDWEEIVDYSKNTTVATEKGITHDIDSREVRYLKVTMLHNSANPGLHISEIKVYKGNEKG